VCWCRLRCFSTQDPAYQALGEKAWTRTYQTAIENVLAHIGNDGIWLMDRGFDDVVWMSWMHAQVQQNVIRMKSNRLVHLGTKQEKAMNVGRLAETLDARYTTEIRYVDKSNHREKFRDIPFTWAPIWVLSNVEIVSSGKCPTRRVAETLRG
jgi:hypothetical protein